MKLWAAVLGAGLVLGLSGGVQVLAHSQAQDGKIGGLLHIDPDDIAKAGQTNTIHIYFNDRDDRFTMEGCDCKIKVTKGRKVLLTGPLDTAAAKTGIAKVFLPQDNFSYSAVVSGQPKTAGFFQPFELNFDINVGKPMPVIMEDKNNSNYLVPAALGVIILATTSCYLALRKRIRMKK